MKSGHGSCSTKRTRAGSTITTSLTFSCSSAALARWKLNFTSSAVEGVAVVELQPFAQLELIGGLVRADGPRLGEARAVAIARDWFHERVVQGVEHPERRNDTDHRLTGIVPRGRHGDVERPAHFPFWLGLGGRWVDKTAREQGAQQWERQTQY